MEELQMTRYRKGRGASMPSLGCHPSSTSRYSLTWKLIKFLCVRVFVEFNLQPSNRLVFLVTSSPLRRLSRAPILSHLISMNSAVAKRACMNNKRHSYHLRNFKGVRNFAPVISDQIYFLLCHRPTQSFSLWHTRIYLHPSHPIPVNTVPQL